MPRLSLPLTPSIAGVDRSNRRGWLCYRCRPDTWASCGQPWSTWCAYPPLGSTDRRVRQPAPEHGWRTTPCHSHATLRSPCRVDGAKAMACCAVIGGWMVWSALLRGFGIALTLLVRLGFQLMPAVRALRGIVRVLSSAIRARLHLVAPQQKPHRWGVRRGSWQNQIWVVSASSRHNSRTKTIAIIDAADFVKRYLPKCPASTLSVASNVPLATSRRIPWRSAH